MKRFLSCLLACIAVSGAFLSAEKAQNRPIDVSIKFFDRTVYYPDSAEDNPVYVKVSIANHSTETYRFKLSDDRSFSMDFNVYNARNTVLPTRIALVQKRSTSRTVYFREIAIEPGEEYSFVENMKDYIMIENPAVYYFTVRFYPELYKSRGNMIESNRLSLDVRPAPGVAASYLPIASNTQAILQPESLSPDKVVEQTIISRQKGLWEQYFLYMDIEQMLMNDEVRNRRYRTASAEERTRMIAAYRADLMQERIDTDIVAIPEQFQIERTEYNATEGTVTVTEWFDEYTFRRIKQYTYYLRQKDGIWQIYRYEVMNLGTE